MTEKINGLAQRLNGDTVVYDVARCWELAVEVATTGNIATRRQGDIAELMNVLQKVSRTIF